MIQSPPRTTLVLAAISVMLLLAGGWYFYSHRVKQEPVVLAPLPENSTVKAMTTTIIGTSTEGRTIEAYTFGNGSKNLVFVGGIHGGYEWNSSLLAYMFIDYLIAHPETIPKSVTLHVIPVANPDGLAKVTGKTRRFSVADVSSDEAIQSSGRFNARGVDLNRNFDCDWKPKSSWRNKEVSGGSSAFSEPESIALKTFLLQVRPLVAVFWHSQSGGVYASQCGGMLLPETREAMNVYASASRYKAVETFDAYATTGAAEDWLASVGIPAITVELTTHSDVDWDVNLAGASALIQRYMQ